MLFGPPGSPPEINRTMTGNKWDGDTIHAKHKKGAVEERNKLNLYTAPHREGQTRSL
jgi:hypothetical protein